MHSLWVWLIWMRSIGSTSYCQQLAKLREIQIWIVKCGTNLRMQLASGRRQAAHVSSELKCGFVCECVCASAWPHVACIISAARDSHTSINLILWKNLLAQHRAGGFYGIAWHALSHACSTIMDINQIVNTKKETIQTLWHLPFVKSARFWYTEILDSIIYARKIAFGICQCFKEQTRIYRQMRLPYHRIVHISLHSAGCAISRFDSGC